jgi:hypothetical protein
MDIFSSERKRSKFDYYLLKVADEHLYVEKKFKITRFVLQNAFHTCCSFKPFSALNLSKKTKEFLLDFAIEEKY